MGFGWEFDAFFFLLAVNAAIAVTCYVAAPRGWARQLCLGSLLFNGFVLLMTLLAAFATGSVIAVSIYLLPWVLVGLEFLLLLQIYTTRCRK